MFEKKLLLDTCALLWLAGDKKEFSRQALDSIQNASIVYVSLISAWEVSLKVARKSLFLPSDPFLWFSDVIKFFNLSQYPLDLSILCDANKLPWHHKDPADRFLIATALKEDATIITSDRHFRKYHVKTLI